MKALFKNREVEVWQVAKYDFYQPNWVTDAFSKKIMQWSDNNLRVLMPALNSNWAKNDRYYGYGMYTIVKIGDIIDLTNCRVVSQKQFEKEYQIIE